MFGCTATESPTCRVNISIRQWPTNVVVITWDGHAGQYCELACQRIPHLGCTTPAYDTSVTQTLHCVWWTVRRVSIQCLLFRLHHKRQAVVLSVDMVVAYQPIQLPY